MSATMGELPLRIIRCEQGIVIRCLCGAESAVIRTEIANTTMTGLRTSGPRIPKARADLTPAGVMRMVLHTVNCGAVTR